MIIFLRDIPWT